MRDKLRKSVFRFAHFAMGTTFELLLAEKDKEYAQQISQAVFAEIDRVKDIISRFNPTSEISQINRLRAGQSLNIGIETYECLMTALSIHEETGGAFDINVGSLMKYRDADFAENRPPRTDIREQLALVKRTRGYAIKYLSLKETEKPTELKLDLGGSGRAMPSTALWKFFPIGGSKGPWCTGEPAQFCPSALRLRARGKERGGPSASEGIGNARIHRGNFS